MYRPVFHISVVILNVYSIWYDQMYLDFPYPNKEYAELSFKGRQVFLTIWCFTLQTIYFAVSFLNDIVGTDAPAPKKTPLIRTLKDHLFCLAFPVAIYVSTAFWTIYTVDKKLVFPDYIEKIFPVWLNHVLHTLVAVFMFIELIATRRIYPSRTFGIFYTLFFSMCYVVYIHLLYAHTKMWPYPIFEVLNLAQRILYFAISTVIAIGFYLIGEKLNAAVSKGSTMPYVNGHANGHMKKNK